MQIHINIIIVVVVVIVVIIVVAIVVVFVVFVFVVVVIVYFLLFLLERTATLSFEANERKNDGTFRRVVVDRKLLDGCEGRWTPDSCLLVSFEL